MSSFEIRIRRGKGLNKLVTHYTQHKLHGKFLKVGIFILHRITRYYTSSSSQTRHSKKFGRYYRGLHGVSVVGGIRPPPSPAQPLDLSLPMRGHILKPP